MKYKIEKYDGLYCVYRCERIGERIVVATESLEKAKRLVEDMKQKGSEQSEKHT